MMSRLGLLLAASWLCAARGLTLTFPYYETIAVCTPINLLVSASSGSGVYEVEVDADPSVVQALRINVTDGKGLGIESIGSFSSSNPIRLTARLPPGVLQYIELDYTNTDLYVNTSFSKSKGEIANNGNGRVVVPQGLSVDLTKVSIAGSGDTIITGNAAYSEIFSSGGGSIYLAGVSGAVKIKQSEPSHVFVDPTNGGTKIDALVPPGGAVTATRGACTMRDPDNMAQLTACTHADSMPAQDTAVRWTCGIKVTGDYACAGGGKSGPPSVQKIACASTAPAQMA